MCTSKSYIQAGRGFEPEIDLNYFNVDLEVDEAHLDADTDPAPGGKGALPGLAGMCSL